MATPAALPEIHEADAPDHIRVIYEEIKEATELPLVNLIYRHFAAEPGVLDWVWRTLAPLYRSVELKEAARALTDGIERPGPSPLVAAVTGDDLVQCKLVVDAYNSGNTQNLIGLTSLVRLLRAEAGAGGQSTSLTPRKQTGAVPVNVPFPPIVRRDTLDASSAKLVEALGARHRVAEGAVPSLYLHLANWPAALEAANVYLAPIIEAAGWRTLVDSVVQEATATADGLALATSLAPDPPPAEVRKRLTDTVETFVGATIPEMVVVGRLLEIRH